MSNKLSQLLSYLDRGDVVRLRFRDGDAVMLETKSRAHAVTVTPLRAEQIRKFFAGTAVEPHIESTPTRSTVYSLTLVGKSYAVDVHGEGGKLTIDVSSEAATERGAPVVISDAPSAPRGIPSGAIRDVTPIPASRGARPPSRPPRDARAEDPRSARAGRRESAPTPRRPTPPERRVPEPGTPQQTVRDQSSSRSLTPTKHDHRAAPAMSPAPADPPDRPPSPSRPTAPRTATPGRRPRSEPSPALRKLLGDAVAKSASDVHLVAGQPVRTRTVGALEPSGKPQSADEVAELIKPLLELRHHEQLASRGYTDLATQLEGVGRFRLNVCRQRTGLKACFRVVAKEPRTVEDLGMPEEVRKLALHHQGLAVFSGPNGHGKTTSMSAIIDMFNATKPLHIITVEDPVEILHPVKMALVTQREVGTHTKSFQSALAGALREDPDIIAIGELRDRETVEMALQASETGHLVVATMSTPSGAKTIDRMIDMFPPDDQSQVRASLAGALKLVVSQRLVPTVDGRRTAAFEMLTGSIPLWSLIRDKKLYQLPSLMQRGRNFGMIKLEDSLRQLVAAGTVSQDDAIANALDPKALGGPGA